MLLKEVSYVYQGCIYLITNAVKSEIVKQYITIKMFSILVHFKIYSCDVKQPPKLLNGIV